MSLITPESVWNLQQSLQTKAKANPALRFYSLYDKIYRRDILAFAWRRCRENGGSAGVDGQTLEQIESSGLGAWLDQLAEELKAKTYRPQAVRRVWIPKADGKLRPLGISTVRDRVVQMAAVIVLAPIFEADLPEEQYAYRTDRSAHDAIEAVHGLINRGHRNVVDADLSGYFDSIPHHELMKSVARRISDGAVLALIQQWLEMAVEETDERGHKRRTTVNKDTGKGTPQGGADFTPVGQSVHETIHPGLEAARLGEAAESTHCELCGRFRDPVPRFGAGSAGADTEGHGSAQADGQREEKQNLPCAGREFRLAGLHDWAVLLGPDWPGLPGDSSCQEAH